LPGCRNGWRTSLATCRTIRRVIRWNSWTARPCHGPGTSARAPTEASCRTPGRVHGCAKEVLAELADHAAPVVGRDPGRLELGAEHRVGEHRAGQRPPRLHTKVNRPFRSAGPSVLATNWAIDKRSVRVAAVLLDELRHGSPTPGEAQNPANSSPA
jgi:hypothetical protein